MRVLIKVCSKSQKLESYNDKLPEARKKKNFFLKLIIYACLSKGSSSKREKPIQKN